jgi:hypothetical protein
LEEVSSFGCVLGGSFGLVVVRVGVSTLCTASEEVFQLAHDLVRINFKRVVIGVWIGCWLWFGPTQAFPRS